ncbi:MAG: cyanophycin synthetase family protein [Janthinobacterium lividum]
MTKDIKFLRVSYLRGPNIWTYRPVIEAWVDIGVLEDFPSNLLPGLSERLIAWLPGLIEHRCGIGERGGFLQRLRDGTWAGHILEHVVLELQTMAGMATGFGKARETGVRGLYKVAFRTRDEATGRAALAAARLLLLAAIEDQPFDAAAVVAELREMVDSNCLGPSTAHIVEAATARSIPFLRLNDGNLVQLGYGSLQRRIWTAETDQTSAIAESISSDKDLTKSLLRSVGIPIPEGRIVESADDAWEAAQDIGLPVAIKPLDGNHGRGVALELHERADIVLAFELAQGQGSSVIVEQFISGNEHRLLVVGRKVVAAARGEAAWVTGDGSSSVAALVDAQINTDPRRGEGEDAPLSLLVLEEQPEILLELERQNLTAQAVPAAGARVLIQRNGNVAVDVTELVHPEVAAAACLAARVIGLDIAGIDLVAEDISRPLASQRGAIIEVNAGPGLLAHTKPAGGGTRNVGAAMIDHLFGTLPAAGDNAAVHPTAAAPLGSAAAPAGGPAAVPTRRRATDVQPSAVAPVARRGDGRIPVIGINGSTGTSLVARLVAWFLQLHGRHVGLACASGLFLEGRQISRTSAVNWDNGQRLLINRSIDAAVIENDNRQILGEGLAYDRCAVGVVTDLDGLAGLAEFHIHEPAQLYNVARTQVDVVLPDGVAVLNAAEPALVEMAGLCDGDVIFYALDPAAAAVAAALAAHRATGRRAVLLRDGAIVLATGSQERILLALTSLKPAKAAQADSVLAAVAAGWALGIPDELIAGALRTYESNPKKTPY